MLKCKMKKMMTVFLVIAAGVGTTLSQGTVDFDNFKLGLLGDGIDRLVYLDRVGGTPLTGANYVALLVYGPTADTLNGFATKPTDQTLLGSIGSFRDPALGVGAGTWVGGARVLAGVGLAQSTFLQVQVWDLKKFATYADALAGGGIVGHSDAFQYTVPFGGYPPWAFYMTGLRAFALVPEPSTLLLGASGIASLLFLRLRKS